MMNFLKKLIAKRLVEKDGQKYIKEIGPFGRQIKPQEIEGYLSYMSKLFGIDLALLILLIIGREVAITVCPLLLELNHIPILLVIGIMDTARYIHERNFPLNILKDNINIETVLKKYKLINIATSVTGVVAIALYASSTLGSWSLTLGVASFFISLYSFIITKEAQETLLK